MAIAMALSALVFASTAGAKPAPVKETYLVLGDSLSFGYSQQLYNENEAAGDPATAFEGGFDNVIFKKLKPKPNGVQLTNDACPGETSESLIGDNPAIIGGLNAALAGKIPVAITGEAPCAYQEGWAAYKTPGIGGPLHHPYVGESQLENALKVIATDAAEGTPVTHVTFNIGPNDELHFVAKCEATVTEEFVNTGKSVYGETPAAAVKACLESGANGLFSQILSNISGALAALRDGSAFGGVNYTGPITILGAYNPYGNVLGTGELLAGSNALAAILATYEGPAVKEFGACYANAQPKFNPQDKSEPKKLQAWTNMANTTEFEGKKNGPDIHPTPKGYKVIANLMLSDCTV